MFRFYIALWASKLMMAVYKILGDTKNDLPGLLASKICPNFLKLIKKPALTITVTGTNGKTTTSTLINDFLRSAGLTTSFNDWGANMQAGYSVNLIRAVNLLNKPVVDCSTSVRTASEETAIPRTSTITSSTPCGSLETIPLQS